MRIAIDRRAAGQAVVGVAVAVSTGEDDGSELPPRHSVEARFSSGWRFSRPGRRCLRGPSLAREARERRGHHKGPSSFGHSAAAAVTTGTAVAASGCGGKRSPRDGRAAEGSGDQVSAVPPLPPQQDHGHHHENRDGGHAADNATDDGILGLLGQAGGPRGRSGGRAGARRAGIACPTAYARGGSDDDNLDRRGAVVRSLGRGERSSGGGE